MIKPPPFALVVGLATLPAASPVHAQLYCLRPPEPVAFHVDKTSEPELYEILNDEYRTYLADMEAYLNCLREEFRNSRTALNLTLEEWREIFGEDAYLEQSR